MNILIFTLFLYTHQILTLEEEIIKYEEQNEIALLTINTQKTLHSLNLQILEELDEIIGNINPNKIHSLIISIKEESQSFLKRDIDGIKKCTNQEEEELNKKGINLFRKIEKLPLMVIASIDGIILGDLFELSMICDIRICSENSVFGLPEVGLGIIPRFGGTQRLARLVGAGMAKQIVFSGQNINSKEALRIKLISGIFPQNELLNEAKKIASIRMNSNKFKSLYNKDDNVNDIYADDTNYINFQIQIKYETKVGEKIYISGNSTDFGNWKPKFNLNWFPGHIWKADYKMLKSSNCIEFKFICHSNSFDKWEEGGNRLLCARNLHDLSKTPDGKYILDFIWNHFKINFNIHYEPPNQDTYMQISGAPISLTNWQKNNEKPIKMELDNTKQLIAKDGNVITGFWTKTVIMKISDKNNLDFEYRYSLYNQKKETSIWEREPNRHIHIYLTQDEMSHFNDINDNKISIDSYYLLTNSFLEVLDVNFVSNLEFNKMGDKNIFIGPYPQSINDFKKLSESKIDTILNVQSDKDLLIRQVNFEIQLEEAKKFGITINRYPIEDFNQIDLYNKLKGAGDILNQLLKEGKKVYVHCTAGMSRAAATVIIYLVLYENYTVEEANNFCKKYRPVICPNYGVINKIASIYKPGSEMPGVPIYNFEL